MTSGRAALSSLLAGSTGPVALRGAQTWSTWGLPLTAPNPVTLDLAPLTEILDYQPEDLTITVEPGVTGAQLNARLAPDNLTLPLDPPGLDTATLGGLVATAATGPLSTRWGSPRRHILGITVMDAQGREHHAGGRVVKNVAGLDLMKLHCGAWGTLGVITEMTFRLQPRPAESATLVARDVSAAALNAFTPALNLSELSPAVFDATRSGGGAWSVRLRFDGFPEDNAHETARAIELARAAGFALTPADAAAPARESDAPAAFTLAAHLRTLSTRLMDLIEATPGLDTAHVAARPLTGAAEWRVTLDDSPARLRALIAEWRTRLQPATDRLLIETATGIVLDHETLWGPPPAHFELMRRLKQTFDPGRRFNPGRYFWGL